MNQNQIDILENLSWESTPEQKKSGFISALRETDHSFLLKPNGYSNSWENASIVFLMLSDAEIQPYIFNLLEWLQDLNWPGAKWISDRLQRVKAELIVRPLEKAAKLAFDNKDECWLGWMSILIANSQLNELDADIFKLLKPFAAEYHNFNYDKVMENIYDIMENIPEIMENFKLT